MATAARPTESSQAVRTDEPEQSGWVAFAAIMLFIGGFFSFIWGLAAVLNDEVVTVGGQGVLIADFTTWGWVEMVSGALMVLTSYGLFAGAGWGRVLGIAFVVLNALFQVAVFSAFPLWSLFVLALDVMIIYQLTAKWVPARK